MQFFSTEDEFQHLQQSFMEKYYLEFEDSEENKLSYTPIFNEYVCGIFSFILSHIYDPCRDGSGVFNCHLLNIAISDWSPRKTSGTAVG